MSKKKFPSATTSGHRMLLRSWIAELVMLRANHGRLPGFFWRDTRWKWAYTREVKAVSKFIKKYGEVLVTKVVCDNRKITTLSDYGNVEYLLQNEVAILNRLALPKDLSKVKNEDTGVVKDLREPRSFAIKKNLFERLAELENE